MAGACAGLTRPLLTATRCSAAAAVGAVAEHCAGLTSLEVRGCEAGSSAEDDLFVKHLDDIREYDPDFELDSMFDNLTDASVVAVAARPLPPLPCPASLPPCFLL